MNHLIKSFQNLSLSLKLNIIMITIIIIMMALIILVTRQSIANVTLETGKQRVIEERGVIERRFNEALQVLQTDAHLIISNANLIEALAANDVEKIEREILITTAPFKLNDVDVVDSQGVSYLSLPNQNASDIEQKQREELINLALLGLETTGLIIDKKEGPTTFKLAVAVPLNNQLGEPIGSLFASREIDDLALNELNFFREEVEVVLLYKGKILAQSTLDHGHQHFLADDIDVLSSPVILNQVLQEDVVISDKFFNLDENVPHVTSHSILRIGDQEDVVLAILVDMSNLVTGQNQFLRVTTFIFILLGILTISAITFFTRQRITFPIKMLKLVAGKMAEGDYSQRATLTSNDEIGQLSYSFNQMATAIQSQQTELEDNQIALKMYSEQLEERVKERTQNLTEAITTLQNAQDQLVEAEKMAALGSLVAGVAHEINTPLGIGVSMASLLANKTAEMETMVKAGKMRVADLKAYVNTAQESSTLILNNLNRAGELVQSFKQVAVDQTSEAQRSFAVRPYLEEVLLNLRPTLKHTNHTIEVEGDETLSLNSYPGSFAQVVTNLVINSITHAFEPEEEGQMHFELLEQNDHLIVTYTDDGRGIPAEHLSKIFEPFFTTARQQGGSGLGLHLVYNLVTQKLKGSIRCESQMGQGTKFIIDLPLNAG